MSVTFIKDTAERVVKTFVQAYLGAWLATGANFDGLTDTANLKIGVVAAAVSIAMAMGLKGIGPNKDSSTVL